jgi:hypothetical protein
LAPVAKLEITLNRLHAGVHDQAMRARVVRIWFDACADGQAWYILRTQDREPQIGKLRRRRR